MLPEPLAPPQALPSHHRQKNHFCQLPPSPPAPLKTLAIPVQALMRAAGQACSEAKQGIFSSGNAAELLGSLCKLAATQVGTHAHPAQWISMCAQEAAMALALGNSLDASCISCVPLYVVQGGASLSLSPQWLEGVLEEGVLPALQLNPGVSPLTMPVHMGLSLQPLFSQMHVCAKVVGFGGVESGKVATLPRKLHAWPELLQRPRCLQLHVP